MANLLSIPGIETSTLELLEAAGFRDVDSLANAELGALTRELEKANQILKISKTSPTREAVQFCIEHARTITGVEPVPDAPEQEPVNYELSPQAAKMLDDAPFAIPLPARVLVKNQLSVSDIPPAILLNRYSGDLDIRVEQRTTPGRHTPLPGSAANQYVKTTENHLQRLDIDVSRLRSTDEVGQTAPTRPARRSTPENERITLLRAPRESTNRGRSPNSPWYIRGVLHTHPKSIRFGAALTLILLLLIPASMVSATLLLLSGEYPEKFDWVSPYLLWIPCLLPVFGIFYWIWGYSGTCRICGQRLFAHRGHLKNSKAHHIPILGYVIPLCFQILIFRWFRCTHCGTPVRLKE